MDDNSCSGGKPEGQKKHICELLREGLMEEIDRRMVRPTVRCAKCGARAALPQSICQPIEL